MTSYTVIKSEDCLWCLAALDLLYSSGEDYITVYNVSNEKWLRHLMLKADLKTVPQVFSPEGVHIGGYQDLVEHLKAKREGTKQ